MANRTQIAPVAVLVTFAVVASACGGDASADAEATEAAYAESVEAISADTEATIKETFDSAFADMEGLTLEALLPEFSGALGTAISVEGDALARFEALEPPQAFLADHERTMQWIVDRIDALTRQRAAADAGNTDLVAQIGLELASMERDALADMSPDFAQYVVTSDDGEAAAALFSDLDADETEYLDAVATGWDEFARRNRAFGEAVQQSYGSDALLLSALLDAGAGEAFAAVRAVIEEIDPPQSYVDGHAQLLAYLDEAVALDTAIGEAAENGDVVAFEVANFGLNLAAARFALEAPPSLVAVNGAAADLVPPQGLPGDAYGEALWQALQRFRILALRTETSSGVFPVVSDDTLAQALALLVPTTIQFTEEAIADVEALDPPAEFEAGHDRILAYLNGLVDLRQSILSAAATGDLDTLRTYGELGGIAAERAETELWCSALADLTDDPIEPITATFFRPFDVGAVAQLCPTA